MNNNPSPMEFLGSFAVCMAVGACVGWYLRSRHQEKQDQKEKQTKQANQSV
jgi:hypothetical protein